MAAILLPGVIMLIAKDNKMKCTNAFAMIHLTAAVACICDGLSYMHLPSWMPDVIQEAAIYTIWFAGDLLLLLFTYYCYCYISERTTVDKWKFYVPMGIFALSLCSTVVYALQGRLVGFEDGMFVKTGPKPLFVSIMDAVMGVFLMTVAIRKRKYIGSAATLLLGGFVFFPLITYLIGLHCGTRDYSYLIIGYTVIVEYLFLERKLAEEKNIEQRTAIQELYDREARTNESYRKAKEEAEAANAAKTSFLFNMSHDIRTPMNAVIGFTNLLRLHQDEPERRSDYLDKIEHSSNVLLSILNNVLEMARIEKGTVELNETPQCIDTMNRTGCTNLFESMQQKGIEFNASIDVKHHYFMGDSTKLDQIYNNLLSNAYKYTLPGGKIDFILKELPCEREGWLTYTTILSDTGVGMSEEFLPHLFEEFAREKSSTDNKIDGTGLGMPIVKRLIELMGGEIEVESKLGVGTTITVTISHRIASKPAEMEDATGEVRPEMFEGKRILLAEDNDLNAEIAIEILTGVGFEVDRADDGDTCVEMLINAPHNHYDLVLMDIQMPRMNGYEATRAIRALHDSSKAGIFIIAMTANAFDQDRKNALEAGMNAHLAKPIDVNVLMTTLAGALA